MADWIEITPGQDDPESPITASLTKAWTSRPVAIAEGAPGAPRIVYIAGTVGSLLFGTGPDATYGDVVAGSTVRPSGAVHSVDSGGSFTGAFEEGFAQTGSWQCLGIRNSFGFSGIGTPVLPATLWQRIA